MQDTGRDLHPPRRPGNSLPRPRGRHTSASQFAVHAPRATPASPVGHPGHRRMSFTIAHLSDAHLSPAPFPSPREMRLKRFMGYVNWKRGRERLNDMAMLARLVADLRAQAPEHVAMTGDVVNLALAREFESAGALVENARRALRRQLHAGQPRRLCPGRDGRARPGVRALDRERRARARRRLASPTSRRAAKSRSSASVRACPRRPCSPRAGSARAQLSALGRMLEEDRRARARPRDPYPPSPAF